jgi:hypothetical protein
MSGAETPEETLAFIYGYVDGERGKDKEHKDGFYYQGYRHGLAGDAHDYGETTYLCSEGPDEHDDDWCTI